MESKKAIKNIEEEKDKTYGIIAAEYKEELIPIPDTEKMVALEELSPGSLDRIIEVSVETIRNVNKLREEEGKGMRRDSLLGLIAGFLIAVLFLLVSWDLIKSGKEIAGTILGTVDLVALVTVFVAGRK